MAVTPKELQSIAANLLDALEVKVARRRVAHDAGIRGTSHVGMPTFTVDAGTNSAQSCKRVDAFVSTGPRYHQLLLLSISRNCYGSYHRQSVLLLQASGL
jgi:hypothetical protein